MERHGFAGLQCLSHIASSPRCLLFQMVAREKKQRGTFTRLRAALSEESDEIWNGSQSVHRDTDGDQLPGCREISRFSAYVHGLYVRCRHELLRQLGGGVRSSLFPQKWPLGICQTYPLGERKTL